MKYRVYDVLALNSWYITSFFMTDDFGNEESSQDNRSGFFQKTNTPKIPKFKVYFFLGRA